jgi:hypothetical protein
VCRRISDYLYGISNLAGDERFHVYCAVRPVGSNEKRPWRVTSCRVPITVMLDLKGRRVDLYKGAGRLR